MDPSVRKRTAPSRMAPASKVCPSPSKTEVEDQPDHFGRVDLSDWIPSQEELGNVEICEAYPIKVLQMPVSIFDFAKAKFNFETALHMNYKQKGLNIYGEDCAKIKRKEVKIKEEKDSAGPFNSVYGEQERIEAKRRRFARIDGKDHKRDVSKQEITVRVQDEMASCHKLKATRRTMQDAHSAYFVFIKDPEGHMVAYPVKDWSNFDHESKNKPLTEEEAEEKFKERHKIMNMFSEKAGRKLQEESGEPTAAKGKGRSKNDFSGCEYMESGDSDSDNDSKTPEDGLSFISNKKQKNRNKSVRKESSDDDLNTSFEDFDEELIYNFAESDSETECSQTYQIGVDQEEGLRTFIISDESESDDGDVKKEEEQGSVKPAKKRGRKRKAISEDKQKQRHSSTTSESNGPPSPLLLLKKGTSGDWNVSGGLGGNDTGAGHMRGEATDGRPAKRRRVLPEISNEIIQQAKEAGITEDVVKRYLTRKPISIADLLRKFISSRKMMPASDIARVVGYYVKKLKPSKETIGGKVVFLVPSEEDLSQNTYFSSFGKNSQE
ncbi:General transcription factor IIF subunit 1 [Folsomia candida]|uniref:Transcription initiation factor IIF subunit alpha n=2 Tax=Folsomia candida TaxID=158441 RepID=A0A226E5C0_FOLCA|nr:General transcription factor IIF subunit 1 [Folsomia candida]